MKAQEIFDTVARHLSAQGRRSVDANELCMYRGADGTKCAVGALISDDEYIAQMEDVGSVSALAAKSLLPDRLVPHVRLLKSLQQAHDQKATFEGSMARRLRGVADAHSLDPEIIDKLSFPEVWK